ncbi:DUF423 domain-containing protein [Aliarcobacter vitoriensis]|uniref:DUF423 domain-containing protein n=1 Tax=Aliarcobacter vitoriensis TaxID=2011099 RepID=A0A366MSA6_9BACT|nr:DUF423 domain-containing protein [Aliarcobacter vitoriensis]RBQ29171.1 DUF423 domain-containing protein [Aliarcobacter vitoriensis]
MVMDIKAKRFLAFASFLLASAVALGAFGAHGLKSILDENMLKVYNTGVTYQFYNTFGLFIATFLYMLRPYARKILLSIYLITIGTLIFSISLYFLTILNIPVLGAITPIGGTLLIIGYLTLSYGILKSE